MKLLLSLLLLLISPGLLAAPPPDMFAPPTVPALSLPPVLPLPLPPSHPSGDLARDRLGKMAFVLLSASEVSLAQPGQSQSVLPPARAKAILGALSDLVLDDALYVGDANYEMPETGSRVRLVLGDFGKEVTVTLWRDKPLLTISSESAHGWIIADYLPVLPKMVKLLREIGPNDPGLNMALVTAPSAPSTEGISSFVLTRIATLKPGMTRADVRRLFTTEGGPFTPYWNHYVYRSMVPVPGEPDAMLRISGSLVKVNVDFAPPDADIDWVNGRGFWLGKNQYRPSRNQFSFSGNPDDIVLKVSPVYIQQMILD